MSKSTMTSSVATPTSPHRIEEEVRHLLAEAPHLSVSSLVVRRIDRGVCLQGVAETAEDVRDICSLTQAVSGVEQVVNRLLVAPPHAQTLKG